MHDFNQFRLSSQTKAPEAIDEAILHEEQRLTYAKDICEAVGLEPQELLEMLQELIEQLTTHAQRVARHGPERALELAASFKAKMASRQAAITRTGGPAAKDPQAERALHMTRGALGANNVHFSGHQVAFGPSANPRNISPKEAQGFDVPGSASVGSLPAEEQDQAQRIYDEEKRLSPAGKRRRTAVIAAANRAKGIARI